MSLRKHITSQAALAEFRTRSPANRQLMEFINALAESIVGKSLADEVLVSPATQRLLDAMEDMAGWVAEIPPMQQAMRYGNKAFVQWHRKLCDASPSVAGKLLEAAAAPTTVAPSVVTAELATYLSESFGNSTRIDYGTGHELAFVAFLCAATRAGVFAEADRPALVLRVFDKYLTLMRRLQTTYWLEPAGSHGVWGLDDYQHLPFFFGAAQLSVQGEVRPSSVHDEDVLEAEHGKWMYLAAVRFIRQVKKGAFSEHSPYLNDISGIDTWQKIGVGLLRMYEGEVLGKLPVVQHLPFGKLLPWSDAPGGGDAPLAGVAVAHPDAYEHPGIRRGSMGTAPPSALPDNRLAVLERIKAEKAAAAATGGSGAAAAAAAANTE